MPTKPAAAAKKPRVDWEAVERDYRAGVMSLREIGTAHGVSNVAVLKHAKRDGWERDLSAKIKARADALVSKAEVSSTVSTVSGNAAERDRAVVDANATAIMRVRMAHRKDIAREREHTNRLLAELEAVGDVVPDLREAVNTALALATSTDPDASKIARQAQDAVAKVADLPSRIASMKMLADTTTKLVTLERQAYSLDDAKDTSTGDEALDAFRQIMGRIDGAGTGLA